MELLYNAQKTYFDTGVTRNQYARYHKLNALKSALKEHESMLLEAIALDLGKGAYETYLTEISLVNQEIDYMLKVLKQGNLEHKVKHRSLISKGNKISYEPRGHVLIIAPFNYPIQLSLLPLVGSYAVGNVSMLKLSEHTPSVNAVIKTLLSKVFDEKEVCVVEGGVEETTQLLNYNFDMIFFTGSTQVGKIVMEAASKTLTPVVLELGGKSPAIVFSDADLDKAVKKIIWGKIINAGQTCIAPDYVMVPNSLKESFIEKAIAEANRITSGNRLKLINQKQVKRIVDHLITMQESIRLGGTSEGEQLDFTILDNANIDEEIFGPVLPVIGYNDTATLLDAVKQYEYPLTLYAFTDSPKDHESLLKRIRCGSILFNDVLVHIADHNVPFGGVKTSGIGRYHGEYSLDTFAHKLPLVYGRKHENPMLKMPFTKVFQKIGIIKKFL